MPRKKTQIFILEDDGFFLNKLEDVCSQIGEVTVVGDLDEAMGVLSSRSFDLLLLDWYLNASNAASFYSAIESFQPGVKRIALFTVPDLANVIEAMKLGARDIFWAAQETDSLAEKIKECIKQPLRSSHTHSFLTRLTESLTEKALLQRTSLFKARKEFSRAFLQQVLNHQNMKRNELADLLGVSSRTLHRHLSV
jgi:DNA-binding NtrC family response regulator